MKQMKHWRCHLCNTIIPDSDLLQAASPFKEADIIVGCPKCRQCTDGFDQLCDEPNCEAVACCGWPTGDKTDTHAGYRRTCYEHAKGLQ